MKKTVVILGNSQLSLFIAQKLGRQHGDLVHLEIIWLTNTKQLFPATAKPVKVGAVAGVKLLPANVKSINLNDRRIITTNRTLEYDLLCIDQTPVFTSSEREKIVDQFETLLATIHSQENRGVQAKARVSLRGRTANSYQLALDLLERKNRDSSAAVAAVRIEVEANPAGKLGQFLRERGLSLRVSQYPGVTVAAPVGVFPSKKIRGMKVDLGGEAMTLATGELPNHSEVLILEQNRDQANLARADWQLAGQIADNITAKLEGGLERPLDQHNTKLILASRGDYYVELGAMISARTRARAVAGLEKRFWRQR
ncbi:MAG: hypothetical protein WEC83_01360 [Patescibacteria group bacterium]